MKEKTFSVYFPVYGYVVNVISSSDVLASRKARSKELGKYKGGDADALHSYNRKHSDCYIFLPSGVAISTIAHECTHAIWRMFRYYGVALDEENFAYHLAYLLDEILKWKQNEKDVESFSNVVPEEY